MLANYVGTLRRFNRNVRFYLLATSLLGFAIDGGVYSVIFNLYLLRLGFGPEFIGQVNSVGLLTFALSSLPSGAVGARFGNRRMMVVGLVCMVVGGFGLPLAQLAPVGQIGPVILGAYALLYLGLALYFVNSVPLVMDIAAAEERTHAFSMQTALLALAAFSGALIGGFLPRLFAALMGMTLHQPAPYRLPLVFAAALMVPAVWAILSIRHEATADGDMPSAAAGAAHAGGLRGAETGVILTLVLLSTVRFFQVGGIGSASTFFNVYMDAELSVATGQIGMLAAVARLMGVPAALLTPVLVARWGAPRAVLGASTMTALSMLPLALIPHWGAAGLGYVGVTALSSIRYPAFLIYSMELVPPNWRGTLAGAGEMSGGLSFALMAFVGGYLIEAQGFTALFLTGAVLATVGTLLFYLWFMLPRARRAVVPTT
ncbi:MAG: hypothetical protein DCC57_14365 [Chloroflexi bacterium]|nr:MAG: hypothetical protein DCC57_14365 [Chloroflexota bacterium]